ncbi:MAG: hypothetical protein Kow0056_05630 [Coriobacteriia bacterium]
MRAVDDSKLASRAASGDPVAFSALFEKYQSAIYNYAYRITGDPEDAKDVTQEAFLKVFGMLERGKELEFRPYLYRTAHNIACDTVGERKRFVGPDALDLESEPGLSADPERAAPLRDQQEHAYKALFVLSEKHRAVLALREMEGLSYQEIADVLEMPRNTVGVYLSRARLQFKEAFRMSAVDTERLAEECKEMLPLLSAYLDDEVTVAERDRVESHLEGCPLCRLAIDEMRESSRSYRALVPLLPPPEVAEAVMGQRTAQATPEAQTGPRISPPDHPVRRWVIRSSAVMAASIALVALFATAVTYEDSHRRPASDTAQSAASTASAPSSSTQEAAAEPTSSAAESDEQADEAPGPDIGGETEPVRPATPPDETPPRTPTQSSPPDGYTSSEATVTLVWTQVDDPSGVTYRVEFEWLSPESQWVPMKTVDGLTDNSLVHVMGLIRERWRVVAVDGADNESAPSPWSEMSAIILVTPIDPGPTIY